MRRGRWLVRHRMSRRRVVHCVTLACCVVAVTLPTLAWAAGSSPPSELVTGPVEMTAKGVVFHGHLNAGGLRTTARFEYSEQACDESKKCIKKKATKPLTGTTQREVRAVKVTGLKAGERYDVRLVAHNRDGTVDGPEVTFTPST